MSPQVLSVGSAEPSIGSDRLNPTFITTWNCPYAQRSWIALAAKSINYHTVYVDLQKKPEWFFKHNPYGRVPTLAWKEGQDAASLYESLVVNEYINDLPGGPDLLPKDPLERAWARLIIDQYGAKVGSVWGKVQFALDKESAAPAAAELTAGLKWLEGEVSSEGPYFLGKDFSLVSGCM
eukprot:GHRR01020377.1.p1 GENE.GHRR01020377.1~~GHRR01020377.1.p1  ORF type:complete len:179 (+),score=53.62 GHRR01020377.1:338-874(+)